VSKLINTSDITEEIVAVFGSKDFTIGHPVTNKRGFDHYVKSAIVLANEKGIVENLEEVKIVIKYFKENFDALFEKFNPSHKGTGAEFMFNAVKEALKNKPERIGYSFIKNASLHPGASVGQNYMGYFLLSCLGDTRLKVNIEEVVLRVDLKEIYDVLQMVESGVLREKIQLMNPTFLEEIDNIPKWYVLEKN